jgi:enamine deaminase RidA (YjgF/YER057c/UK114 family)
MQDVSPTLERFETNAAVGYSQATRAGDIVFVSGQVAVDAEGAPVGVGDAAAQARVAFDRLERLLVAAGSGLQLVTKITVFTTDRSYIPAIRAIRQEVFGPTANYPASTFAVVAGLAEAEYLVEVEAIALRGPVGE